MTEGRDMSTENNNDAAEQVGDHVAGDNAPVVRSRRNLVKAGLIAAPLLVTLRSRPLYAQSSLGSLGISYGLYTSDGASAVENPDFDPNATSGPDSEELIEDPNGDDRRPGTADDPGSGGG